MIGAITSCGEEMIELEKRKKIETKYIWETIDVIPLLTLVGMNHRQPIIQMSKTMVYLYTRYEQINPFKIGYMINPSLHINRVFI